MNNRPIKPALAEGMIEQIFSKFDKVEPIDLFYSCVALSRGARKLPQKIVSSDLFYAIYLKLVSHSKALDLYQLSQIANFLCSPQGLKFVPDELWTTSF